MEADTQEFSYKGIKGEEGKKVLRTDYRRATTALDNILSFIKRNNLNQNKADVIMYLKVRIQELEA